MYHDAIAMQSEGTIRWHAGRYHAACAKLRARNQRTYRQAAHLVDAFHSPLT